KHTRRARLGCRHRRCSRGVQRRRADSAACIQEGAPRARRTQLLDRHARFASITARSRSRGNHRGPPFVCGILRKMRTHACVVFALIVGLEPNGAAGDPTPASARPPEAPISDEARRNFAIGVRMLDEPGGPRYDLAYQAFKAAYQATPSAK